MIHNVSSIKDIRLLQGKKGDSGNNTVGKPEFFSQTPDALC